MSNNYSKNKITLYLYLLSCIFFFLRYFIFNIPLGYGIGDIVYLILFSIWALISLVITWKSKNKKILITASIINIALSIYTLLMMFEFRGIEK